MKIKRLICIVLLCAVCAGAWWSRIANTEKQKDAYEQTLSAAQQLVNDGLYQRALENYERALTIKDTPQLREMQLTAAQLALGDGVIGRSDYVQLLESACKSYPDETGFWKLALARCLALEDYKTGYRLAEKLPSAAASQPEIRQAALEIAYTFSAGPYLYSQVRRSPGGYAAVCTSELWGILKPNGDELYAVDYRYIGPLNAQQDILLCTDTDSRILDKDGVVQARIKTSFTQANAYADGLLPVCTKKGWSYYDCAAGGLLPGSYTQASAYENGTAAVCKNGVWTLIDRSGGTVSQTQFQDVKLYGNGQYCYQDRMVASENSTQYALYDASGNRVNEFSARDMDVYLGGMIAFADAAGRWGFVSEKGEVVIEPAYEAARSFSGGLAAVKTGGKWGFINKNGEMVIPPQFAQAEYFSDSGVCYVGDSEDALYTITLRFPQGL